MGATSINSDADDLAATAQSALDELVSLLNTQYNGRHLFSGSMTGNAPVDLDGASYDLSTPQTDYYKGNDRRASVRVSSSQVVDYGVMADSDGIETAIRVLASFVSVTGDTLTDEALGDGMSLLSGAIDDILVSQTGLSLSASTLEGAIERNENVTSLTSETVGDLTGVDVAQVAVNISSYEARLNASYAALAKILSVNLDDYIR